MNSPTSEHHAPWPDATKIATGPITIPAISHQPAPGIKQPAIALRSFVLGAGHQAADAAMQQPIEPATPLDLLAPESVLHRHAIPLPTNIFGCTAG